MFWKLKLIRMYILEKLLKNNQQICYVSKARMKQINFKIKK